MNEKIKVIYIMGWGRSGSTILANILGQRKGFFSVGEIHAIWDWGCLHNRTCGCGTPFHQCGFWSRVVRNLSARRGSIDAERWNRLCRSETRTLHTPNFLLAGPEASHSPAQREYLGLTAELYEAVRETSECRVIVDSSKSPLYGGLLGMIPNIELSIVHLIRDPRAAAYSWSVQKPQPDLPMKKLGPAQSSILWITWNAVTERIGRRHPDRYLRVRYEDFIRRPRKTMDDILRLAREEPAALPFTGEHSVFLNPTHTVRGNPDRFQTGAIELRPDDRCKKEMPSGSRWISELLAWPMMVRYGYSL